MFKIFYIRIRIADNCPTDLYNVVDIFLLQRRISYVKQNGLQLVNADSPQTFSVKNSIKNKPKMAYSHDALKYCLHNYDLSQ